MAARPQWSSATRLDPYNGEAVAEIALADQSDVDEAYQSAACAAPAWAAALPAERATVMLRSANIMRERRDEIIDWLIRKAGSTSIKAQLEWKMLR